MSRKLGLIEKILSGEKKIESRWYKNRIAPWNKINIGDVVYFKNSGGPVFAMATVKKVKQFDDLDVEKVGELVNIYGKDIALQNWDYQTWGAGKRYCILIWLQKPKRVRPFKFDKTGFGNGVAWMCFGEELRLR